MKLYTPEQVADVFQITERAVGLMLKRGHLAYVDVCATGSGKRERKRIREEDLLAFLEKRRQVPKQQQTPMRRRRRGIV